MADPRFYDNNGPIALGKLAEITGSVVGPKADPQFLLHDVMPLACAAPAHASFYEGSRYRDDLARSRAGAIVLRETDATVAQPSQTLLLSTSPLLAFSRAIRAFYPTAEGIRLSTAGRAIHPSAIIGEAVEIEHGVVIGAGAEIGRGTRLGAGCFIGRGVAVGQGSIIGPGASIAFALLGDRVIVHPGARIGQDGFGYAKGPQGQEKIFQLGRVIIQDDVEIGANTAIDRGALADTVIGEGTKIDNLVQIGHNTTIGRGCILVSQVGLSGSITLGDNVVLGGKVGVADHLTIGTGATVAAKSGVTRDLPGGQVYGGFPARPIGDWRREVAAIARLTKGKRGAKEGST